MEPSTNKHLWKRSETQIVEDQMAKSGTTIFYLKSGTIGGGVIKIFWSFELNDLWSKICRPKMIFDVQCYIHPWMILLCCWWCLIFCRCYFLRFFKLWLVLSQYKVVQVNSWWSWPWWPLCLYIEKMEIWSGVTAQGSLADWLTTSKDRAPQLLSSRNRALVMQFKQFWGT